MDLGRKDHASSDVGGKGHDALIGENECLQESRRYGVSIAHIPAAIFTLGRAAPAQRLHSGRRLKAAKGYAACASRSTDSSIQQQVSQTRAAATLVRTGSKRMKGPGHNFDQLALPTAR